MLGSRECERYSKDTFAGIFVSLTTHNEGSNDESTHNKDSDRARPSPVRLLTRGLFPSLFIEKPSRRHVQAWRGRCGRRVGEDKRPTQSCPPRRSRETQLPTVLLLPRGDSRYDT
jgi:hypothetical protein